MLNILPIPRPHLPHVALLLRRYWYEYRQVAGTLIVRDVLDRLIYLLAFGFGLGGLLAASHGGNYLAYLTPGIACSAGAFVVTLAMTFGVFERAFSNKIWLAWLATPLRLPEIVLAELAYAVLRTMPSLLILIGLAAALGAVPSWGGALLALPLILLANFAFGAIALCFTVHIHRMLHFAYVATLWTTPNFLFAGVFFDVAHSPWPLQALANLLPLYHVLEVVRPLMLGEAQNSLTALGHIGVLGVLLVIGYTYACAKLHTRLMR